MRLLIPLGIAVLIAAPAAAQGQQDFSKVEITTTKISNNFVALDGQGGRIGVLYGPDGIFMVDSQFAPLSEKIMAAIRKVSDQKIRFLVNTHVHGDHTGGNENFGKAGATIVARPMLKQRLIKPNPPANGGQAPAGAPAAAIPGYVIDERTRMTMDGETIDLIPLPVAHTDGDTAVKFVKNDVLMTGDVFRSEGMPAAAITNGGSVLGILKCIDLFLQISDANTKVVPGHGPVANRDALVFHRQVLVTVRDRVAKAKAEGKTLEEVQAMKPTAEFDQKVGGPPAFIPQFVATLYNELPAR